ncbi:hypothetical protein LQ948_14380 [Jiella sp. MQZ9-1]|uniref:Uncharacterized protein n=1 Tax=Jiella flava TaxID=2816857 RepID=A0A939FZQ5_9HYPH|nr:hypothetical protein [Jiella flava]MBO0663819.1 hypothetical protein [Jiella flava]MCD2472392.1 hypothetical protein [Jiella flava]
MMEIPNNSASFEAFFKQIHAPAEHASGLSDDCLHGEPTLAELLDEPIARLLMACDRVDPDVLEEIVRRRFA